jgi:hypothetical protein
MRLRFTEKAGSGVESVREEKARTGGTVVTEGLTYVLDSVPKFNEDGRLFGLSFGKRISNITNRNSGSNASHSLK